VRFKDVSCTPEQVRGGAPGGNYVADTSAPDLQLPTPRMPRPRPSFVSPERNFVPLWVYLTFVVDTIGTIDLCTVRIVRQNEPKWTRAVLEALAAYRYDPGRRDGVPVRVLIEENWYFRPPFQ